MGLRLDFVVPGVREDQLAKSRQRGFLRQLSMDLTEAF